MVVVIRTVEELNNHVAQMATDKKTNFGTFKSVLQTGGIRIANPELKSIFDGRSDEIARAISKFMRTSFLWSTIHELQSHLENKFGSCLEKLGIGDLAEHPACRKYNTSNVHKITSVDVISAIEDASNKKGGGKLKKDDVIIPETKKKNN